MDKRERELRQAVATLKKDAQALIDEGKHKEARAKLDKAKTKKAELDNFLALKEDFKNIKLPEVEKVEARMKQEQRKDETQEYKYLFFKVIRGHKMYDEELEEMDHYMERYTSKAGQ